MTSNKKIMILPGDGVGPEVVDETKKSWIGLQKIKD